MNIEFEIKDIHKRLYMIENILFDMTNIIDIARNYEDRLSKIESKIRKSHKRKLNMQEATLPSPNKEQQVLMIRNALLEKAFKYYHQLIEFLKNLPLDQKNLQHGFFHLDDGMLWMKQMMESMPINLGSDVAPPVQPETPQNEPIPESKL